MNNEDVNAIAKALTSKIPSLRCPMCGKGPFTFVNGYIYNHLHEDYRHVVIGTHGIPSIVIVCNNCGFMSQHALGALGLLHNNQPQIVEKEENSTGE